MDDAVERRALGLVVAFFRHLAGRYQQDLSDLVGIDQQRISRYETGVVRPRRPTLERLALATGASIERLDQLIVLYRAICTEVGAERSIEADPGDLMELDLEEEVDEIAAEVAETLKPRIHVLLTAFEAALAAGKPPLTPQEARDLSADQWRRIAPLSHEIRLAAFEFDEFRHWALCERLCEESLKATTDDPEAARNLAEEALTIAEKVSASEASRQRLVAYALAHLARVDAAFGDSEEAADKLERARELWLAGDGSDDLQDTRFESLLGAGTIA